MDFFLANPPMQPKLALANYVAANGYESAPTYRSFEAVVETKRPFQPRNEHWQDYAGVSGILESPVIYPDDIEYAKNADPGKIKDDLLMKALYRRLHGGREDQFTLDLAKLSQRNIFDYCHTIGIPVMQFLKDCSFSYWEHLDGYNLSIVADNAIPKRYHVFTNNDSTAIAASAYAIIDDDTQPQIRKIGSTEIPQFIAKNFRQITDYYEGIRKLPLFESSHCPIIECQWVNGALYFLQYHRTRDFEPARFELKREAEEGELEATFVRGATPPEGIIVNAGWCYPKKQPRLAEHEEAAINLHFCMPYEEIMLRRRGVQFFDMPEKEFAANHLSKSLLFKPGVTFIAGMLDYLAPEIEATAVPIRVPIEVVSDGRCAFAKPLNR